MRIGLVAPYEELAKVAAKAAKELDEDIEIGVGNLSKGVRIAREMESNGIEAIISRGGTALAIAEHVDIPVVEIKVSGFDILRALHIAKQVDSTVGVIGFKNVIYNAHTIQDILGVKVREFMIGSESEAEPNVARAQAEGISVVAGDVVSTACAERYGMKGILIRSGEEAIAYAIQEAKHVVSIRRKEQERQGALKAILDFAYDGVIGVDRRGVVTVFNPVAERILGISARDVVGKPAKDVLPEMELHSVREKGKSELGELRKVGNVLIVSNRVPITVNGEVTGAVVTFQEAARIQRMEEKLRKELYLKGHIAHYRFQDIVGSSVAIREAISKAERFAAVNSTVLIIGESGSGKELFAQSIHNASPRRHGPFVAINCAALPESLLESELFGYEEGAFTGARKGGKPGLFELAHRGTIFLDEVGDLPLSLQARLLRVIEQKEVMRVGGDRVIPVDVRIIAATHSDLKTAVEQNAFRSDLYYRLNILTLHLPPLRERKEDIPVLASRFIEATSRELNRPAKRFTPEALAFLVNYPWPGNVRELKNFVERIVVALDKEEITLHEAQRALIGSPKQRQGRGRGEYRGELDKYPPTPLRTGTPDAPSLFDALIEALKGKTLKEAEIGIIGEALRNPEVKRGELAKMLGISRSTLWRKLKKMKSS